ncbi:hypothetical protein Lfu02_30420 [Longispora fulva]|uniref:DUF4184 family protein n=1 Tax=Longispora fulva TaxID=619741 RepID=A0A8J7GLU8_9ACTN|nr:DUF4184 family protein [Longispora fulva]MBG6139178.1 hypothetical protein [Longispora fulva]GIG58670.1 hypothetical protein Lfu02_30420 [Longispora fulva]
MPLTFPSHAAIVVPLKIWRPRWFDGVALVLGSTAPDLPYSAVGVLPYTPSAHNVWGVLLWCLPATLLGCRLIRWAAPAVAARLPGWGRDYGVLGRVRHPWYVTASSALLGAVSHLFWDGFTHDPAGHGWATRELSPLTVEVAGGYPLWWFLQQGSTVLGALATAWLVVLIGRRGLLRAWHGDPDPAPAEAGRFWGVALGVTATLAAVSFLLPAAWFTAVIGVRLLESAGLGLLAGAWAVRTPDGSRT